MTLPAPPLSVAFAAFEAELVRCRDMCSLAVKLSVMTGENLDTSDVLRAAFALGVGALDNYVHSIVREVLADTLLNGRAIHPGSAFPVPLWLHKAVATGDDPVEIAQEVRRFLQGAMSRDTYQLPDDIANVMRYINAEPLWVTQCGGDTSAAGQIKAELKLVVTRRNQIVHEADIDPSTGEKWSIDAALVLRAFETLTRAVAMIERHAG